MEAWGGKGFAHRNMRPAYQASVCVHHMRSGVGVALLLAACDTNASGHRLRPTTAPASIVLAALLLQYLQGRLLHLGLLWVRGAQLALAVVALSPSLSKPPPRHRPKSG